MNLEILSFACSFVAGLYFVQSCHKAFEFGHWIGGILLQIVSITSFYCAVIALRHVFLLEACK